MLFWITVSSELENLVAERKKLLAQFEVHQPHSITSSSFLTNSMNACGNSICCIEKLSRFCDDFEKGFFKSLKF
jgi:predicted nucleic acid binding AN1-type Zn finger protein